MTQYYVKQGRNFISFLRLEEEATQQGAIRPAYQMSTNLTMEPNTDEQVTKDGTVNIQSGNTTTVEVSYLVSNDPTTQLIYNAVRNNKVVEHWLVDLSQPVEGANGNVYKDLYMQGTLASFELPAEAEGGVEVTGELNVNGQPQEGTVELSDEMISDIQYVHRDLSVWNEDAPNSDGSGTDETEGQAS